MAKDKLLTVRVTPEEKKALKTVARAKKETVSSLVLSLLRQSKVILLLISVFALLGCSTISYLPANSYQTYPPSNSIEVLYQEPQKSYIALGKIIIESGDISEQSLYKRLKQKAINVGANAIIIQSTAPAGTDLYGMATHRIEALAIRWQQDTPKQITP